MTLILNPEGDGLAKVFRDYQEIALRHVWKKGDEGVISREVWTHVNENLNPKTISRASIINFLNAMVDEGVLDYTERTGKGGYHRVYRPKLDETDFKKFLAETVISSLMRDFPNETKEAIKLVAS
jgi:predicted transcriptional regulator